MEGIWCWQKHYFHHTNSIERHICGYWLLYLWLHKWNQRQRLYGAVRLRSRYMPKWYGTVPILNMCLLDTVFYNILDLKKLLTFSFRPFRIGSSFGSSNSQLRLREDGRGIVNAFISFPVGVGIIPTSPLVDITLYRKLGTKEIIKVKKYRNYYCESKKTVIYTLFGSSHIISYN